jgi:hypothetical protein
MAMEKKIKKITGSANSSAAGKPVNMGGRDSFYNTKNYAATNKAASTVGKLTGQQKAERGRTAMREIAKMNPLDKSIVLKKPMKSQNKNPGKYVR